MSDTTANVTIRLSRAVKERLSELAAQTERSEDELMTEAIESFVELRDWQAEEIRSALRESDEGGPFIAHEDMARWLQSWGSEDELPPPKASIRRRSK